MLYFTHILTFRISFKNFSSLRISIICLALLASFQVFAQQSTLKAFKTTSAFIENKGQIIDQHNNPNPSVLYLLNSPGFNVQLRKTGFSYDVYQVSSQQSAVGSQQLAIDSLHLASGIPSCSAGRRHPSSDIEHPASSIEYHRIDFDLLNANLNPVIETSNPSPDYFNYFTASAPSEGIKNIRQYTNVTYKNILTFCIGK